MNEYIEILIYFASMVLTWILGYLSKKSTWVNNNIIPIQNFCLGVIIGVINYIFTKDVALSLKLGTAPLLSGGTYDIYNGVSKIKKANEEWEQEEEKIGE